MKVEQQPITDSVNVLGVALSAINMRSAKDVIAKLIETDARGYVCVTGVHGVIEAQRDAGFRQILNRAALCTPDGMPMTWLGRLQGFKQMDRVYGPDLMLELCEMSQGRKYKHFLYGGAEGVAEQLRQKLLAKFPQLNIVGTFTPPFRPLSASEETELADIVRRAKPDIFWVGLSTPKQERFMAQHVGKLDTKVMIGVGAAFDIHNGTVRQAPRWIQRSGLEWLFRLLQEPRRLAKRYLINNPLFVYKAALQLSGLKRYRPEKAE